MNSQTQAGQAKRQAPSGMTEEHKKSINEAFALFRANYQHLYFSAYPDKDSVNLAKRLWLESLEQFTPETIRAATHAMIKQSDYLPTISRMIRLCASLRSETPLPDAHSAYVEACNASSPKQNYSWAHPAVYYAGQNCGWFFLANNTEAVAYPIFKGHYEKVCEQMTRGVEFPDIELLALPESIETPLSKEENAQNMAKLRRELNM